MRQPDFRRLATYLGPHPPPPGKTVTLTFEQIERVLGGALPLDAYDRVRWWLGADTGPQRRLQSSGWRIERVDVLGHLAIFGRDGANTRVGGRALKALEAAS